MKKLILLLCPLFIASCATLYPSLVPVPDMNKCTKTIMVRSFGSEVETQWVKNDIIGSGLFAKVYDEGVLKKEIVGKKFFDENVDTLSYLQNVDYIIEGRINYQTSSSLTPLTFLPPIGLAAGFMMLTGGEPAYLWAVPAGSFLMCIFAEFQFNHSYKVSLSYTLKDVKTQKKIDEDYIDIKESAIFNGVEEHNYYAGDKVLYSSEAVDQEAVAERYLQVATRKAIVKMLDNIDRKITK